jgi:streptolysin S family bacteriocin protoxin
VEVFDVIDKVEDKYFASDATVAPGGWCCWCWCCCSINFWRSGRFGGEGQRGRSMSMPAQQR